MSTRAHYCYDCDKFYQQKKKCVNTVYKNVLLNKLCFNIPYNGLKNSALGI